MLSHNSAISRKGESWALALHWSARAKEFKFGHRP